MARTKNTANSLMSSTPAAIMKQQNATTSSNLNNATLGLPIFSWHNKLKNNLSMSPTAYSTQHNASNVMQPTSSTRDSPALYNSIHWHKKSLIDSSKTTNYRDQFRAYLALQKYNEERTLLEQREREYFRKKLLILNGINVDATEVSSNGPLQSQIVDKAQRNLIQSSKLHLRSLSNSTNRQGHCEPSATNFSVNATVPSTDFGNFRFNATEASYNKPLQSRINYDKLKSTTFKVNDSSKPTFGTCSFIQPSTIRATQEHSVKQFNENHSRNVKVTDHRTGDKSSNAGHIGCHQSLTEKYSFNPATEYHQPKITNRSYSPAIECHQSRITNATNPADNHSYCGLPIPTDQSKIPIHLLDYNEICKSHVDLTANHIAARHTMTKKLPRFYGEPTKWQMFESAFINATLTCGLNNAENLPRLLESLQGKAIKAVECRLLHSESVSGVMATLRLLYGRPELIIHSLLKEINKTAPPQSDDLASLIEYSINVQNLCSTVKSYKAVEYLRNPTLMKTLTDKLPSQIQLNWAFYKHKLGDVDLSTLGDWLYELATVASDVVTIDMSTNSTKNQKDAEDGINFVNAQISDNDIDNSIDNISDSSTDSEKFVRSWLCNSEDDSSRHSDSSHNSDSSHHSDSSHNSDSPSDLESNVDETFELFGSCVSSDGNENHDAGLDTMHFPDFLVKLNDSVNGVDNVGND